METKVVTATKDIIDEAYLIEAGAIIRNGGLVAFPTETVYGLGGDGLNPDSARKIYAAKGRPSDNPLIVHIAKLDDLDQITEGDLTKGKELASHFWPGPLTMIFKKSDLVPLETTGGLETVAVRMPDHKVARDFIREAGGYVAAPSANISGRPSPTIAKYVIQDMSGRIDMILDGGLVGIGIESTILDLTSEVPTILRPGAITQKMIEQVIGTVEGDPTMFSCDSDLAPKAPGMKYKHYAPKGNLKIIRGNNEKVVDYICENTLVQCAQGQRVGIIATNETKEAYKIGCEKERVAIKSVGNREDEDSIARRLYQILREFDDEEITCIYSESFETGNLGQAIMNRLLKAAGHEVEDIAEMEIK